MVGYQYSYLIGDLILLVIWVFLFMRRKDTRKEMVIISFIFGILGPFADAIYIQDWWKPITITNTPIGIETFLFGFLIGGIMSVIYEHLFNKRIKIKKKKINSKKNSSKSLILLFLIPFIISFFILKINSFYSTIIAVLIPLIQIYYKRADLIKNSLLSGLSSWGIMLFGYTLLNLITPGFFEEFWYFTLIGKKIFLGIPLEEHIWFFLIGTFIGPLYEYWQEAKLINIKK